VGSQLAAVHLAHLLGHRLGVRWRQHGEGSAKQRDHQIIAPERYFQAGRRPGDAVPLRRPACTALLAAGCGNLEVTAGCQLVEVMPGDIRVEGEPLGDLACGHSVVVLARKQIDLAAGRIPKRAGDGNHRGRELGVREGS